jgi:hypothetical protein
MYSEIEYQAAWLRSQALQQSRTPEQYKRIPDKKASQLNPTTSWFLCSPK